MRTSFSTYACAVKSLFRANANAKHMIGVNRKCLDWGCDGPQLDPTLFMHVSPKVQFVYVVLRHCVYLRDLSNLTLEFCFPMDVASGNDPSSFRYTAICEGKNDAGLHPGLPHGGCHRLSGTNGLGFNFGYVACSLGRLPPHCAKAGCAHV